MKLPFQVDLSGKTAVVTGAGGVLCSVFSKALAACGAKVALLDINLSAAEEYAAKIRADGFIAKAYQCDVLDRKSVQAAHERVMDDLGPCALLVNGAGGNNPRATTTNEYYFEGDLDKDLVTFFNLDPAGVEFVFNLNFLGALIPTQVFAQDMLGMTDCCIVNISSMNSFCPLTKIPAYSGAKAAISNFTQWLAVHFSKVGIRVNAIAPGFFLTKQNEKLLYEDGKPTPRTHKIISHTPLGRFGEPEDLLGVLLFLVSEQAAGFVTGVVIPVDGGFSSYSGV